jgi:hypothetical protein
MNIAFPVYQPHFQNAMPDDTAATLNRSLAADQAAFFQTLEATLSPDQNASLSNLDMSTNQLCADCYVVINRFEKMSFADDHDPDKYEGFRFDFKTLDHARYSSGNGCRICTFVVSRQMPTLSFEGNTRLVVNLSPFPDKPGNGRIFFKYPEQKPQTFFSVSHVEQRAAPLALQTKHSKFWKQGV